MRTRFNHAANDSPRSGSSTIVFAVAVLIAVAVAIWLKVHA